MKNEQIEKWEREKREKLEGKPKNNPKWLNILLIFLSFIVFTLDGPPILYLVFIIIPYLYKKVNN